MLLLNRHEASIRKKLSPVNRVLRSKRVIAVLVSLSNEDIAECYQSGKVTFYNSSIYINMSYINSIRNIFLVLARFHEWFTIELKSTSKLELDFCNKMSEQIIKIYNIEINNTANFSIFPTKVTKEQPKIVILLKNPVKPNEIRVELSRGKQTQVLAGIRTTNPYNAMIRMPGKLLFAPRL